LAKRRSSSKKAQPPTTVIHIQDAVDLARAWLYERSDYYGFLARREQTRGAPELARHLRGDLLAKQGRDGSWGDGNLAATSEAIWRLLDLGIPSDSGAVARGLDWLFGQRDQDGAYGFGCTPARHEQRLCEHYVSGFFSPGAPDDPQELTLPNGQSVTSDVGARLLASQRALRSVLRANRADPRAVASVSGLRSLPLYLDYGGSFTPALSVGALQALAWADGPQSSELTTGLETLAREQGKDGAWPNVELFFVLETLLEVRSSSSLQMLQDVIPRLVEGQMKNGAWGRRHQAAQTWIAVQVLERADVRTRRSAG